MSSEVMQNMHRDIAVVSSDKLVRIRELVEREPTTSLANRILRILNESYLPPAPSVPLEEPKSAKEGN